MSVPDQPDVHRDPLQLLWAHLEIGALLVDGNPFDGAVSQADPAHAIRKDRLFFDPSEVVLPGPGMPFRTDGGIKNSFPVIQGNGLRLRIGQQHDVVIPADFLPEVFPDRRVLIPEVMVAREHHDGPPEPGQMIQQLPDRFFADPRGPVKQVPGDHKQIAVFVIGPLHHGAESIDPLLRQDCRLFMTGVFQPDMIVSCQKDPDHSRSSRILMLRNFIPD